jgi:hypothetical protein
MQLKAMVVAFVQARLMLMVLAVTRLRFESGAYAAS